MYNIGFKSNIYMYYIKKISMSTNMRFRVLILIKLNSVHYNYLHYLDCKIASAFLQDYQRHK